MYLKEDTIINQILINHILEDVRNGINNNLLVNSMVHDSKFYIRLDYINALLDKYISKE